MAETPSTSAASIASPEPVLICDRCEQHVYRLNYDQHGDGVCDTCLEVGGR